MATKAAFSLRFYSEFCSARIRNFRALFTTRETGAFSLRKSSRGRFPRFELGKQTKLSGPKNRVLDLYKEAWKPKLSRKKKNTDEKNMKRCFLPVFLVELTHQFSVGKRRKPEKKVCQPLLLFCGGWNEDGNNIFLLSQKFPFLSLVKRAESAEKFWGKQSG